MRNLMKFLALVLAMMMVFSLMITVSAADAFTDADLVKERKYANAIDTLQEYGVLKGDENGNFNPDGEFSRAEMAGIAYRIAMGDVEGKLEKQNAIYAQKFTDVGENHWAAPYIGFCVNWGIVNGVNAGFDAIQTGISANLVDFDMSAVATATRSPRWPTTPRSIPTGCSTAAAATRPSRPRRI